MFNIWHALLFAVVITIVLLLSVYLQKIFGDSGAFVTTGLAALVELHAAVVTIAELASNRSLSSQSAQWGLTAVLAASVLARSIVAFISGGRKYGVRVTGGLFMALMAFAVVTMLDTVY